MTGDQPKKLCPTNSYSCYSNYFIQPITVFTHIKNISTYIEKVKQIKDPILHHISLYLGELFEMAKNDFTGINNHDNACWSLNRWLDQMKNIYTSVKTCKMNERTWNEHIEGESGLWNFLKVRDTKGNLCNRASYTSVTFPNDLVTPVCHMHVPETYICNSPEVNPCPEQKMNKEGVSLLSAPPPSQHRCIHEQTVPPEAQISSDVYFSDSKIFVIGFSIFSTLFAIFFILLILYKFTPLVSWLYNRRMKNKRFQQHFSEEELYEPPGNTYTNSDYGRNYLHYYSMQN
ncbi:PIR Superfamily Protein [Plasmodium ovale wallikeri]|uniref:PIR Superfamily Protein n=1 Tax=Plasmodium ovale wallikeri TaxID=864142 RepID=A0A1A9A4J8_PLAOA|nr:PIR Superfamily Protein [Plasmodium ovale wallikeri]SBT51351.1 PIR Superfamily Protein [Plasmodium ovale wallikeri]